MIRKKESPHKVFVKSFYPPVDCGLLSGNRTNTQPYSLGRPADKAWITLAVGVLVWEIFAPDGELLSEAVDRYRRRRPLLTRLVIVYLSAHLSRIVPRRLDPLHRLARLGGRRDTP